MTSIAEETGTVQNAPAAAQPKPTKKARVAPRRAHVAPKKGQSGKKASPPKKATKGGKKASKSARIVDLLKQPGGTTAKELMKITGWQAHSVRGFLSGTIGKKLGLKVVSTKGDDGERTYLIKA